MVQVDRAIIGGRALRVVGAPVEVHQLEEAEDDRGQEEHQEGLPAEHRHPGRHEQDARAEAEQAAQRLELAVLDRVAVQVEHGLMDELLEPDDVVPRERPVARHDRVRVVLEVVGVAVVALVEHLPRGEARQDHHAAELADDPIERPWEARVRAHVHEHVAEDAEVRDHREPEQIVELHRPEDRALTDQALPAVARARGDDGHERGRVDAVVIEVEVPVLAELRERQRGEGRDLRGGHWTILLPRGAPLCGRARTNRACGLPQLTTQVQVGASKSSSLSCPAKPAFLAGIVHEMHAVAHLPRPSGGCKPHQSG